MKNNETLWKEFLKETEKILDDNYFFDLDEDINKRIQDEIKEFEKTISKENIEIPLIKEFFKKKIAGKKVISYSSFSKFILLKNVSLDLISDLSDVEIINLIKDYKEYMYEYLLDDKLRDYLQIALAMSKASQSKGIAGQQKVKTQLECAGYSLAENYGELSKCKFTINERIIKEYIDHNNIEFIWSKEKQNKMPDFLFINKFGDVFIGEHKNIRESGGAQDKQINELISFIKKESNSIIFVAYCDGAYFNKAKKTYEDKKEKNKKSKIIQQMFDIEQAILKTNNYFVGTKTFEKLIEENKSGK